jgi:hypothetical protein
MDSRSYFSAEYERAMTNQMKANTNGNMNGTKTVQKLNFFSNSPSVQFFFYSIFPFSELWLFF